MQSEFQFELKSLPPAKERLFQELKKTHGSFFAFHGSPFANWHSILRSGLKNLSGTTKQVHGAVSGNGIYMAPNLTLSMGYAYTTSTCESWTNSMFGHGSRLACVAADILASSYFEEGALKG